MGKIPMHALSEEIRDWEERLLHTDFRREPDLLERLLDPLFEEVGAAGVISSRSDVCKWLRNKDPEARWEIRDFAVRMLGEGLVLATYSARQVKPRASLSKGSRRSSIWTWSRELRCWRMLFHQASKIQ